MFTPLVGHQVGQDNESVEKLKFNSKYNDMSFIVLKNIFRSHYP